MLLIIRITSSDVRSETRAGNTFHEQDAVMVAGPDQMGVSLSLSRPGDAYLPGDYTVDGSSFDRDRYRRLILRPYGLRLVRLADAVKQAVAAPSSARVAG